jgi:hypothetical protein
MFILYDCIPLIKAVLMRVILMSSFNSSIIHTFRICAGTVQYRPRLETVS